MSAPATRPARAGIRARIADYASRPLFDYLLLLAVTALLTGIGLVMVLSSSMAVSGVEDHSVWRGFLHQAAMVAAGVVVFWLVLRMRVETIRSLTTPLLVLAFALLLAVLAIGVGLEEVGSQSWLVIGPIRAQPSEFAKIALAMWGSRHLAHRVRTATTPGQLYGPFALISGVVLGLVVAQRDLGMAASIGIVVMLLALFSGLPMRIFAAVCGIAAAFFAIFTMVEGFRTQRVLVYLDTLFGRFPETRAGGYQSYQGFLSLADGSLTGVGIGQSRAKWFYLPEAKNDFIFAIIGEETGFFGAALVVALYAVLGWVGLRIALKQADPFLRLLAATLTTGTVVQAFINMGYVVGLLPVTGLQLPLISAGGTSAVVTLGTMGLLATCARHEPETVSAMQVSGRPLFDRLLAIPEPLPYEPARSGAGASRTHRRPQRFGPPVTRAERDRPERAGRAARGDRDPRPAGGPRRARPERDPREPAPREPRQPERGGARDGRGRRAAKGRDRGAGARGRYGEPGRRGEGRGGTHGRRR
ncbi:FtsW/RodA/SpoVE family cell cycle protein [Corynebacterium sphenisci]|uniref:FtsW/RodA/SpoVE family cell cycle protein n=1 Tax=Corynebacterium sphenisci TaxID=191493 RepID=UPI000952E908|nr:FtsW/RodA/SpoVE family cell cycle protein [Corynebacterium sphenisci]